MSIPALCQRFTWWFPIQKSLATLSAFSVLACCAPSCVSASESSSSNPIFSGFEVFTESGNDGTANTPIQVSIRYGGIAYVCPSVSDFEVLVARQDVQSGNFGEITSLGVQTDPPNDGDIWLPAYNGWRWMPTSPGKYMLWARLTNYINCPDFLTVPPTTNHYMSVLESEGAEFYVHPQNDAFSGAIEFPGQMTHTNFSFTLEGASSEASEPEIFRHFPAQHSLWWKWKPTRPQNVRIKAAQADYSLPIEVFTGTTLENLRRVNCDRDEPFSRRGFGSVQLRVTPNKTYFIRVDDGNVSNDPMIQSKETKFTLEAIRERR